MLGAASRLFADRGYGLTSMRDIARAARIRVASLYHPVHSKDQLSQEVRERDALREGMNAALAEERDFRRQIERMVGLAFDHHRKNPSFANLGLRALLGDGLTRPSNARWLGHDGGTAPAARREGRDQGDRPGAAADQGGGDHPASCDRRRDLP